METKLRSDPSRRLAMLIVAAAAIALCAGQAGAVLVYVNDTTATRNTTFATGSLEETLFKYEGRFGQIEGTVIGSQHFITAKHAIPAVNVPGTQFIFNAQPYTVASFIDDPASDLRIVKVTGTFPFSAPLYTATTEMGRPLLTFGRGRPVGSLVSGPATPTGSEPKGFQWGAADLVESWGQNNVESIVNAGAGNGLMLGFAFDRVGTIPRLSARPSTANEAALTEFDSGGGVFVQDPADNVYKLAGVNYFVDGPFSTDTTSGTNPFNASIYDRGGLYQYGFTASGPITDALADQPGFSFATRISSNLAFINANVPEPATAAVLGVAALGLLGRRRSRQG